MAEGKIVSEEESFNDDSSDGETISDDLPSSESDVDDDSKIFDEDPVLYEATLAVGKMLFIERIGRAIGHIEKDIEELELRRTKFICHVAQMIINCHMNMLFGFRESLQKRLKEMKYGVQPVQESLKEDNQTLTDLKIEKNADEKNDNLMTEHGDLQVNETTTAENPKKDSAGTSPLGGSFPKQGQEGKCMLDLKPDSSLKAEEEMKKADDDKQLSSDESIAEIKHLKTQYAFDYWQFDGVAKLLSVNRAKAKGLKKGNVGDVDADLKGGKETTVDCDIKSNPGNEEKGNN